jgi:signal transduction histidine kinase
VALLLASFAIVGPLATVRLPRVTASVPLYAAAMFVNTIIIAVLLFTQFSILRTYAVLAISCGYLFAGLILIPWMLMFPGVITPTGLLGAGSQSAVWLYVVWHTGFPILVLAYALLKSRDPPLRVRTGWLRAAMLSSVGGTAGVVIAATFLVTAAGLPLPALLNGDAFSPLWPPVAAVPTVASVAAAAALWRRRGSVLDLWLMVVMCAQVIEIVLVWFPDPTRFSIGWYAGRVIGVVSGSLVLFVLLREIATLYARLLRAVSAERRERVARLMTGDAVSGSIAHEIRQPLAAITASAAAGRRWLARDPPNLAEATAAFEAISTTGRRASALIESIRAMFQERPGTRTFIGPNELVGEALMLLRDDLREHRIALQIDCAGRLPQVNGDRVQLQQVLVNLISNAIESMASTDGPRELCVTSTVHETGGALISVADTGPGVDPKEMNRIFSPLVTTKTHGVGMGLSVCRSILEAHGGRLWMTANLPRGAVFQLLLPASPSPRKKRTSAKPVRAAGGDAAAA